MPARISKACLALLVVPAAGFGGWRLALAIGPPAVADDIDILVFILLAMLAGWACFGLLSSLRCIPAAWQSWRAGLALPVLMKEMRQAMRGKRMPVLLLAAAILSVGVGVGSLYEEWYYVASATDALLIAANLGNQLLRTVFLLGALLVLVLAPGLTAGAVSGEREKGTLEMLLLTRMSPGQITWGKLLSGLSVLGVILLCMLPVAGVGFMLGGVAGWQLLAAVGMLAAAALCFGAVGLWCSARFRRTAVAVAVAYLISLALIATIPFVTDFLFLSPFGYDGVNLVPFWLLMSVIITAAVLLTIFTLLSLNRRFPRGACRAGIAICAFVVLLGSAGLLFGDRLAATMRLATDNWTEYIEYLDPILAFGILLEPSGYFAYELPTGGDYYAEFDEDWPIVLSNLAVFLLITKLMLALTRRRLNRLRQADAFT